MSELRLRLMGTPEVWLDGVRLSIQRRRALALLAFLTVTGRPHRREVLATLLAGDAADAQAHKHLSNALADLRTTLGDYLIVERQTVSFDCTRPYWLDVAAIRSLLADGIPTNDVGAVQRAVDLYQDEFLAGLVLPDAPAFDEWLTLQREQLGQLLVRGLQTAIEHHARTGTAAEGIAAVQRLLAEDPWREEAHRQLMALLAASGQRSAALSQYGICRQVLAEELGVEPSAETKALYERLRSEPVRAPHNLPPATAPLIGREAELDLLAQRLSEPAVPVLAVVGPGGAGKSWLALECARRAAAPAADGNLPFPDGVFAVSFAEAEAATAGADLPAAEAGQRMAAAIAGVLRMPVASTAAAAAEDLLAALHSKALLLVLDDLDCLAAGAGLLRDVTRRAPRVRFLLTSRRRLPLLGQSVLELHGLPVPQTAGEVPRAPASALFLREARRVRINAPLGEAEAPHVARLCRLVDGLPLALILAAGWLRAMPCARIAAEVARGLDVLTATAKDLPARHRSMRVVLQSSWQRLSLAERAALRRLSVFRQAFDWDAAVAVAEATPEQLLTLIDSGLIRSVGEGRSAMNVLVRGFAAEQLAADPSEAAATRARHAAYFADVVAARTWDLRRDRRAQEEITALLADVWAAWEWVVAAAEPRLFERLRAGLSLYFELTSGHEAGAALFATGASALRQAAASADRDVLLGTALAEQARLLVRQHECERAAQLVEEAEGLAAFAESTALATLTAHCRGELLREMGQFVAAGEAFQQAAARAKAGGLPEQERASGAALAAVEVELDRLEHVRRQAQTGLWQARAGHDRLAESEALTLLAAVDARVGDFASAQTRLERALGTYRDLGAPLHEARALGQLGSVLGTGTGHLDAAERCYAAAESLARRTDAGYADAVLLAGRGRLARERGDLDRAVELTRQALAACRTLGRRADEGDALRDLGMLAHYQDDDRHAVRLGQEALQVATETGRPRARRDALMLVGHAALGVGQPAAAAEAYEQALVIDQQAGAPHLEIEAVGGLARVALDEGDFVRAATRAADVLDFLTTGSTEGTEEPARLYLTCGRVLEALGDRRAPGLYGAAHGLLEEQASRLDAAERQDFLQRLPAHRAVAAAWLAQRGAEDPAGVSALIGVAPGRGPDRAGVLALPQPAASV